MAKAKTPPANATVPTAMDPAAIAGPAPETIIVHSHRIACDGVGGAARSTATRWTGRSASWAGCSRRIVRHHRPMDIGKSESGRRRAG